MTTAIKNIGGRPVLRISERKHSISVRVSYDNFVKLKEYRNKSATVDVALNRLFKQEKEKEAQDGCNEKEDEG